MERNFLLFRSCTSIRRLSPCHPKPLIPVPIPAVLSLRPSAIVLTIRPSLPANTTSPTVRLTVNFTVADGWRSATCTSKSIRCVNFALKQGALSLQLKFITSCPSTKAARMKSPIFKRSASPATLQSQSPKPIDGRGGLNLCTLCSV